MGTVVARVEVPDEHRFRISAVARALERGMDDDGLAFRLERTIDHSAVSGTGLVAAGVQLPDGLIVLWWTVPGRPSTCTIAQSWADIAEIHGHHDDTVFRWVDEPDRG